MDGESKFILLLGVIIVSGTLLLIVAWTLAIDFIEGKAAIRCAEYGYNCPKEDEE